MDRNGASAAADVQRETLAAAAGHTDSYVDLSGRAGCVVVNARVEYSRYVTHVTLYTAVPLLLLFLLLLLLLYDVSPSSACVLLMPVVSPRRQWQWWWWWCCSSLFVVPVLLTQWPSSLDRVVPLLLAYTLMPPDHVAVGGRGGSRVRETKKALLGRSRLTSAQLRSPFVASTASSSPCTVVPIVVKGTVSKITEKFQAQPPPAPPPRTLTRIPKPLRTPDRGVVVKPLPPPLPPLPPPVVKYEIKRRQEKLLGELHRRRGLPGNRPVTAISFSGRLPVGGGGDSAVSSDCGSSSDSEKSVVCCGGRSIDKPDDKPGSPHSSGYESVEETMSISSSAAVPYSWVFGALEPHDGFDGPSQLLSVTIPLAPPLSTSSSASSDGCCEGDDDDDDDDDILMEPEDRLERLVTFASAKSCPALTRAKPDQDDDEDVPVAIIRRHFGGGNDGPKPVAAMAGYLSPIPECSSTEPNSVETVEDCCGYDDDKVGLPFYGNI